GEQAGDGTWRQGHGFGDNSIGTVSCCVGSPQPPGLSRARAAPFSVKCPHCLWSVVMSKIEVYSTAVCPYCVSAKNLLKSKGLEWTEVRVDADPAQRDAMLARSGGRRTVPQIFINDRHVGG